MSHNDNGGAPAAALLHAGSPSWSIRAAAGRRLAAWADDEEVGAVLQRLLLDAHNTAVTRETAQALLERRDLHGLRAVLAALSLAETPITEDWLAGEIDTDPRWATDDGTAELLEQLASLATDKDAGVRDEARRLLSSGRPWAVRGRSTVADDDR